MKTSQRTFSFLLAMLLLLPFAPLAATVAAQEPEAAASPLQIELKAAKGRYTLLGKMEFTAVIKNVSDDPVEDISAKMMTGASLAPLRGSETICYGITLEPGQSVSLRLLADIKQLKNFDLLLAPIHWLVRLFRAKTMLSDVVFDDGRPSVAASTQVNLLSLFSKNYDTSVFVKAWYKTPHPRFDFLPDHLIVNQIYGLGNKNDDGQAGSHSFVELYNPTRREIDLAGWSLQAAGAGAGWSVLPLKGKIPAFHSFLVLLTKHTNIAAARLVLEESKADQLWADAMFPNKGLKVVLLNNATKLAAPNPFNIDGNGAKAAGYVDMVGIAGNDAGNTIDGCEAAYPAFQSKQVAVRRANFGDTDNNKKDLLAIDYRTADLALYTPKSLGSGAVYPMSEPMPGDLPGKFPKVLINFNNGETVKQLNKEEYTGAHIAVKNAGEFDVPLQSAGVRLRGNTTAGAPKKPMRIRFDAKTSMFGRLEERSWVLLANYCDFSQMRDYMAHNMYRQFSIPGTFASMTEFVDVYVNGVYQGVYLMCDQIDSGPGRVNIRESTATVDTGYLIEYDARVVSEGEEDKDYFRTTVGGYTHGIRTPDPDDGIPPENVAFIKDYMSRTYAAIHAHDWTETTKFIEPETFVDYFMHAEVFQAIDIAEHSVYMHKDAGARVRMGPVWDHDISAGNAVHKIYAPTGYLWAEEKNPVFHSLMETPEFFRMYAEKYLAQYEAMKEYVRTTIDSLYTENLEDLERNHTVWPFWDINHGFETPEIDAIKTYKGQVDYLRDWLVTRLGWLAEVYAERLAALPPLEDDPAGGPDHLIINQIYGIGTKNNDGQAGSHSFVELYNPTDSAVDLTGWSLQAAGNGVSWQVLPLAGAIPPKHSFLVLLTKHTNPGARLDFDEADADMLWNDTAFPNKNLKVALLSGTAPLTMPNPFDIDGNGAKAAGYVDMIGVAGNDAGDSIDGCETAYHTTQSKQNAFRRTAYQDTDHNVTDVARVDYRSADLGLRPRSLSDGAAE